MQIRFQPTPPLPSTSVWILFFKGDMTEILWMTINQRTTNKLQNKENTVQGYLEMSNQNTKKSPGIEGVLFKYTGRWERLILGLSE